MNRKDILWLTVIIVSAFLLRIYFSSLRTILESWDSTAYLWLARSLHEGNGLRLWPGAPAHTWFQPLYSYFISVVYPIAGNYETAGYFIAALFGSLLILPVFLFTKLLFSKEAAYIAAIIFVFHFRMVEMSSVVITEMPYAFFGCSVFISVSGSLFSTSAACSILFCAAHSWALHQLQGRNPISTS